jgi:hypothetical protein
MKTMKGTLKNAAAFLVAGLLFFSCAFNGTEDYGTLVVMLPGGGSDARAAVSEGFTATLSYQLECGGPGGDITAYFNSGDRAAVSLIPGNWTVTVSVLNAAGETIGSGSAAAAVTAGETTSIEIPVVISAIGTSRNDITSFAITSPVSAEGVIGSTTITVYVPDETATTSMNFTLIHTGVSINHSPGIPLNFSSPQTFTVTAEDATTKSYTVTVISLAAAETWPSATTWETYGLAGLPQPSGTTVDAVNETNTTFLFLTVNNELSVTLGGSINDTVYDDLKTHIAAKLGSSVSSQNSGGIRVDTFEKSLTIRDLWSKVWVSLKMDTGNNEISIKAGRRSALSSAPDWW